MEDRRVIQTRRIIGVPVMPGLTGVQMLPHSAPVPHPVIEEDGHQQDMSSTESSPSASRRRSGSGTTPELDRNKPWKLCHVDFFPATQEKSKKEDDVESFAKLVSRANDWLRTCAHASLFSAETVTWMAVDRPVFTDNGVLTKSMHTDMKTRVYKGLRLWYHTTDDTFYPEKTTHTQTPLLQIAFQDFTIDQKSDSVKALLSKLNMSLFDSPIYGKAMRLETLNVPTDVGGTDTCYWREEPQKDRTYMTFLRLLYVNIFGDKSSQCTEFGLQDFVPRFNQRSPHNQGYETYAEVWKRVARWMFENPGYKYINIQSVYVKYKKDASDHELLDRCFYKEHGCAVSSIIHNQRTDYFQAIRVSYTKRKPAETAQPEAYKLKLAYKTFTPCRIQRVAGEEELSEHTYEDLGQLEAGINTWIHCSGARLVSIETAPVRMLSGGQGVLGTEATFVNNSKEKNTAKELWRVNIRLYLEGSFQEVSSALFNKRSSSLIT